MTTPTQAALSPTDAGYTDVNGLYLYYERHGDGPPLVLLHGGMLTIELNFATLIPTLATSHTVIGIEQQGHGRTANTDREITCPHLAADIVALLDRLGIEKAALTRSRWLTASSSATAPPMLCPSTGDRADLGQRPRRWLASRPERSVDLRDVADHADRAGLRRLQRRWSPALAASRRRSTSSWPTSAAWTTTSTVGPTSSWPGSPARC